MYPDIQRLKKAGYKVEEKSPWHFQVVTKRAIINIWPSKKKYMREWGDGASYYTDVVATVEQLVGKPGQKRDPKEGIARSQAYWQKVCPIKLESEWSPEEEEVMALRLGGLDYIREVILGEDIYENL